MTPLEITLSLGVLLLQAQVLALLRMLRLEQRRREAMLSRLQMADRLKAAMAVRRRQLEK